MFKYDMNEIKKITQINREAWNEVMPLHQKASKQRWDERFSVKAYSVIADRELNELNRIGFKDKDIVHLCCNNGVELMSLKNLGAAYCLGVDISDEAILEAQERANKFSIDVDFLHSDVYELSSKTEKKFDIVYITVGALSWLPDLEKFWSVAYNLLRDNGLIFMHEMHPFPLIFEGDENEENPFKISYPYFTEEPEVYNSSLDYLGKSKEKGKTKINFTHTMSDIFESLIAKKFSIAGLKEYPFDIALLWKSIEKMNLKIPLSYILTAKKMS